MLSPQDCGALAVAGAPNEPEAASALGALETLDGAGCCCGSGAPTAPRACAARCSPSPSSRTHRSTCQVRDEGMRAMRAMREIRGEDDRWTGDTFAFVGPAGRLGSAYVHLLLPIHASVDRSIDLFTHLGFEVIHA